MRIFDSELMTNCMKDSQVFREPTAQPHSTLPLTKLSQILGDLETTKASENSLTISTNPQDKTISLQDAAIHALVEIFFKGDSIGPALTTLMRNQRDLTITEAHILQGPSTDAQQSTVFSKLVSTPPFFDRKDDKIIGGMCSYTKSYCLELYARNGTAPSYRMLTEERWTILAENKALINRAERMARVLAQLRENLSSFNLALPYFFRLEKQEKQTTTLRLIEPERSKLLDVIDKKSPRECWKIFKEILKGVCTLHSSGLAHQAIDFSGIFINENGEAVIGNFFNCRSSKDSDLISFRKNPCHESPEKAKRLIESNGETSVNLPFSPADDVWSIGIIALQICMGVTPAWFFDVSKSYLETISKLSSDWLIKLGLDSKRDIDALIMNLLEVDPEKRINARNALKKADQIEAPTKLYLPSPTILLGQRMELTAFKNKGTPFNKNLPPKTATIVILERSDGFHYCGVFAGKDREEKFVFVVDKSSKIKKFSPDSVHQIIIPSEEFLNEFLEIKIGKFS